MAELRTVLTAALLSAAVACAGGVRLPAPTLDAAPATGTQTAVLAGGCFWCTEAVFEELKGVTGVVSGYAGGKAADAHYEMVSSGGTGHAESIQITFRPAEISYGKILQVFFSVAHDPTTLDRQGPDWGKQYRSAIFYQGEEQKKVAEAYIRQLTEAKVLPKPIVTQVVPMNGFYPAEAYHQDFVKNNPDYPYVVVNARPKLAKLHHEFPELIKKGK